MTDLQDRLRLALADRSAAERELQRVSVGLGDSGRMATCRVDDFRGDIWLMMVPGLTR